MRQHRQGRNTNYRVTTSNCEHAENTTLNQRFSHGKPPPPPPRHTLPRRRRKRTVSDPGNSFVIMRCRVEPTEINLTESLRIPQTA